MFYLWVDNLTERRESMTLYASLQKAIDAAVMHENRGFIVQVRNAATGILAYD